MNHLGRFSQFKTGHIQSPKMRDQFSRNQFPHSPGGQRAAEDPRFESVHGAREARRPATYGQLVTAGETATHSHSLPLVSSRALTANSPASDAPQTPGTIQVQP